MNVNPLEMMLWRNYGYRLGQDTTYKVTQLLLVRRGIMMEIFRSMSRLLGGLDMGIAASSQLMPVYDWLERQHACFDWLERQHACL